MSCIQFHSVLQHGDVLAVRGQHHHGYIDLLRPAPWPLTIGEHNDADLQPMMQPTPRSFLGITIG
jgi:hypothetical protein